MAEKKPYNALPFLARDIKNHAVTVIFDEKKGAQIFYLVLTTSTESSLISDFIDAYGADLKLLAESIIGETNFETNTYGVLYDENLKMVFAFNRKLADYDYQKCRVVYKDPQQFLSEILEAKLKQTTAAINIPPINLPPITDFDDEAPDFPPPGRGGPNITFLYSIVDPAKK